MESTILSQTLVVAVESEHPGHSEISINYYYVYRGGRLYFWTIKADSQANNCRG